ncbi:hypothetical protein [Azospirillum halopraeferens]|uniref:hypothetical protein n=1 Tax=Azospirillum halopraeferens TaxID=34010 RepID=UPI0012EC791A|nr:hypothetical protein [Azospirillum halopraeferens]
MANDVQRVRSPRYPSIGLPDALDLLGKVYKKNHTYAVPKEAVIKAMGYSTVNGASATALATLMQYGLMEKAGHDYRISGVGLSILEPHGADEKPRALRAAAEAPSLFAELLNAYPGPPPGADLLRAYLVRKGFTPAAIPQVIRSFLDTLELVRRESAGYNSESPPQQREEPVRAEPVQPSMAPQPMYSPPPPAGPAADLELNEPNLSIRGGQVRIEALLDFDGLTQLEEQIKALKLLMKPKASTRPTPPSEPN